jgi:hypothetical protein
MQCPPISACCVQRASDNTDVMTNGDEYKSALRVRRAVTVLVTSVAVVLTYASTRQHI